MNRSLALSASLFTMTLVLAPSVRADIEPAYVPDPCAGKKVGDPCDGGACKEGTCCTTPHVSATILHYESQKPLAQQDHRIVSRSPVCSPCLTCEAQASSDAPAAPVEVSAPATPATGGMCTIARAPGDAGAFGLLLCVMLYAGRSRVRR